MVVLTAVKGVHRTVGVTPILGFAVESLKQDCIEVRTANEIM